MKKKKAPPPSQDKGKIRSAIYFIKSFGSDQKKPHKVWEQNGKSGLAQGHTSLVVVQLEKGPVLIGYDKVTQKTDAYRLCTSDPWIQEKSSIELSGGPWDSLDTFVLGNNKYLMAYRRDTGDFGFYQIRDDLTVSKPFVPALGPNTLTNGFTAVAPFTSVRQQYFIGYDSYTGRVASFSLVVKPSSGGDVPPLHAEDIWEHKWSNGWKNFVFFQLGGSNFFFKINPIEVRVNIDHILDDPSKGTVEIGTYQKKELTDALSVKMAAKVPWIRDEPYLLTWKEDLGDKAKKGSDKTKKPASGLATLYGINSDCRGWTEVANFATPRNISSVVPYSADKAAYALFYSIG